jgi:uncharacterized membrane protein YecN with MAPEG domain
MTQGGSRLNADPAHAPARRRLLARSIWLTVPGTVAAVAVAYALAPVLPGYDGILDRVVLALRWLFIAFLPYAAVCLLILRQRFFEGSHNPLLGSESERLAIHCRVMQNTLEQLIWFALCLLPLATYLTPAQVRLVPILCVAFAAARLLYWWGYLRNATLGRAPGVQATFTLNVSLLAAVSVFFLEAHFA